MLDTVLHVLNLLFILLEVLLLFNLLILVHEIGHFLAAKWRGLYVDGFGIWFGKPIWKKKINGVTYSLGTIPAGGFVKLPQMAPMEAIEGETEVDVKNLPPISALDKIIVAFAGPLFSFGLAFVFAVIVWQVGRPVGESESTQIVGYVYPDMPAAKAGFRVGDKILEVDGHVVHRWGGMGSDSITWRIVRSEGETVPVKVLHTDGTEQVLNPKPKTPEKPHWWNRKGLRQIGLEAAGTPVVAKVDPGSAGDKAGLKPDDHIEKIENETLYTALGIYDYMAKHPANSYTLTISRAGKEEKLNFVPGAPKVGAISDDENSPARVAKLQVGDVVYGIDNADLKGPAAFTNYIEEHAGKKVTLHVKRNGADVDVDVTPRVPEQMPNGITAKAKIGIGWDDNDGIMLDGMGILSPSYPGPVEQIRHSMGMIVHTVEAVASPKSSIGLQHMGGPVMMMRAYYMMFENKQGWKLALWFSVVLNVNLALLNLLPIPVLDGGHITLALVEAIRRKPVSFKILEVIQTGCAVMIIGFMLFIFFFDVQDLPWFGGKAAPAMRFKAPSQETGK